MQESPPLSSSIEDSDLKRAPWVSSLQSADVPGPVQPDATAVVLSVPEAAGGAFTSLISRVVPSARHS
jgi:hypothetical protein